MREEVLFFDIYYLVLLKENYKNQISRTKKGFWFWVECLPLNSFAFSLFTFPYLYLVFYYLVFLGDNNKNQEYKARSQKRKEVLFFCQMPHRTGPMSRLTGRQKNARLKAMQSP
jgi:hypothetical protein